MVTTVVERLSPTRVKLAISVPPEDLKASIAHAYGHIAEQVSIPGFRKGKVPPPIIDQRVGRGAVLEHAVNDGLDEFFRTAVAQNDLRPLGKPQADIVEWPNEKDFSGDLKVDVEVDVRPEIDLPSVAGISITVDPATATDADVDEKLDELRARFGTLITVDRPATKGDFLQLDLIATIGDEQVDTANQISYELGSGELLEGLDDAVETLTAGESTTFKSVLLGGDHEGEEAEIAVTILQVKERDLPELDDEFAQMASEFDTLDELKADLTAQVERDHRFAQASQARDRLAEHLLETIEIPVPQSLIDDEVQRHLESENRLDDDVHRAEVIESSEKSFKSQILFDALAESENVQVSQDELIQYIVQSAQNYGMQPQEFMDVLQKNGAFGGAMSEVARSKALAVLLGRVQVVDTDGNAVDLTDLIVTDDEPAAAPVLEDDLEDSAPLAASAADPAALPETTSVAVPVPAASVRRRGRARRRGGGRPQEGPGQAREPREEAGHRRRRVAPAQFRS